MVSRCPICMAVPLRVVAPGFPGSAWQKWLTRIEIRDREHDGERMTGLHYRMPRHPLRPGDPIDPSQFDPITDMPVRSVITFPRDGFTLSSAHPVAVRGYAWSGHIPVASVDISIDGGKTWQRRQSAAARRAVRLAEIRIHTSAVAARSHRDRRARDRCEGKPAAARQRTVESTRLLQQRGAQDQRTNFG